MSEIITLGKDIWQLPTSKTFTKEKGDILTINWAGTKDAIEALAEELKYKDFADNIQITTGATYKLSYTSTVPEGVTTTVEGDNSAIENAVWEIGTEQIDTDIKACSDFVTIKDYFAEIDLAISNGNMDDNGQFDIVGYCQSEGKTIPEYWVDKYGEQAGIYYQLKTGGVTSFPLFRWVIKQTITINKKSTITLRGEGFDKKPLVVESGDIEVPLDINFTVPSGYQWLVIPPQLNKQGNKKTIVYEWRGQNSFSPTLYNGGNKQPWEV